MLGHSISGEIYSSKFRSNSDTSTNYVEIDTGDSPVRVVENNKTVLEIWTSSKQGLQGSGGSVLFRDVTADDVRGFIGAFNGNVGGAYDGIIIQAEDSNSIEKDIVLLGNVIRIAAESGVLIQPAVASAADVYLDGDLHVTGDFSVGGTGKGCIIETADYGERWLYAVEGPEIRLEEKGCGVLVNGQCRIDISPKFLQTIEKDLPESSWVIDVTPYFRGKLGVTEIGENYFVVSDCDNAPSNGRFAWTLSGVKKGCIGVYMPEFDPNPEGDLLTSNWEDEYLQYADFEIDDSVLTSNWEDDYERFAV